MIEKKVKNPPSIKENSFKLHEHKKIYLDEKSGNR